MTRDEWKKINQLFHQTVDLSPGEREELLAEQAAFIRGEVVALIASHENASNFIVESVVTELGLNGNSLIGSQAGSYRLLEVIGSGGMGTVFRAEKDGFGKNFAVKLIKRGMDTDSVLRRFELERQILSRLEHPNIARVFDGGMTGDGLPYFVMEYVAGMPITSFCEARGFDTKERLELIRKVFSAVQHAHQNLIVHRDLKPSNILVTNDGIPKLLDFGIAKLLSPENFETTATQARMFTPEYASPEQLSGLPITTASDVYSLGVVLYELLSGQRPFTSDQRRYQEVINLILTEEPDRPSSVVSRHLQMGNRITSEIGGNNTRDKGRPLNRTSRVRNPKSLRGDLDNIVLKSLRKEPERRYQSIQEFSEDIGRHLQGLPVTATADSRFYRFSKFAQRHKKSLVFSVLITLFLSISTAFSTQQYFLARAEKLKADERVSQMRDVAKALLNETSQNLKTLPEGLEIRQSIIANSAAILDSLSPDIDDAEFLSELGDAYQQLGHTRNWHLRQYQESLNNLLRARQLHEKVVSLEPENPAYRRKLVLTLGALGEFYAVQGSNDKLVETYDAIGENISKQIDLDPNDPELFYERSVNRFSLRETLNGLGMHEESDRALNESLESVDRALYLYQKLEKTPENQRKLILYLSQKGTLHEMAGKKADAISSYEKAAETADFIYSSDQTQMLAFNHSIRLRRMMADVYRSLGDWQKALEIYQFCFQRLSQNRENKSLDEKTISNGLSIYQMRIGVALDKVGQKKAGKENLEMGLRSYLTTLKKFEKYAADIVYAPEFLIVASDFYVDNNQKRKAADLWLNEYSFRVEKLLQDTPNDAAMLSVSADCFLRIGDLLSGYRNDRSSFLEVRQEFLKESLGNFENALNRIKYLESIGESHRTIQQRRENLEQRILLLQEKLSANN